MATLDLGNLAVDVGASPVFGFLATGTSEAGIGCGSPFPFLFVIGALAARAVFGGPFSFLFLSLEEDGSFFLAGAVARASTSFSGTGMGATAATSAMDARAASIAESGDPSGRKFRDTEGDVAAEV